MNLFTFGGSEVFSLEDDELKKTGSVERFEGILGDVYQSSSWGTVVIRDNKIVQRIQGHPYRVGSYGGRHKFDNTKEFQISVWAYAVEAPDTKLFKAYLELKDPFNKKEHDGLEKGAFVVSGIDGKLRLYLKNDAGLYNQADDLRQIDSRVSTTFIYHGGLYDRLGNAFVRQDFKPFAFLETCLLFWHGGDDFFAMTLGENGLELKALGQLVGSFVLGDYLFAKFVSMSVHDELYCLKNGLQLVDWPYGVPDVEAAEAFIKDKGWRYIR